MQLGETKKVLSNVGTFFCYSLLASPAALPAEAPWLSPIRSLFALSRLAPLASERNVADEQERGRRQHALCPCWGEERADTQILSPPQLLLPPPLLHLYHKTILEHSSVPGSVCPH